MRGLQKATDATVLLGTMMEDELVYVDKCESQGGIRVTSEIGWRRPLHYGMLGMISLAYAERDKVRKILKKFPLEAHTQNSITDRGAFSLRLEQIRKQGHVVEYGEAIEGITGIAGPIRNHSRKVIAALGVALLSGQIRDKHDMVKYVHLVKETCDKISSDLGYLRV